MRSALHPGQAERRKRSKYMCISNTYEIQPVAFETSGVCGPDILRLLNKVGRIADERRHVSRERRWLMEPLINLLNC